MPGKHATFSQIKQIIALREIGATRAVIASETGVSISTVSRICKRFGSCKGRLQSKLLEDSQQQLINRMNNDETLHVEAMKLLADDLAASRIIREKIAEAALKLDLSDPDMVAASLRALNSASSALATVQKIGRVATGADKLSEALEELPELTISVMTAEDIEAERTKQRAQVEGRSEWLMTQS